MIFVLIHLTILKDGIPFALALACSENPNLLFCGARPLKERQKSIKNSTTTSDRITRASSKVNHLETGSIESVSSKVMNSYIYINSYDYVVS